MTKAMHWKKGAVETQCFVAEVRTSASAPLVMGVPLVVRYIAKGGAHDTRLCRRHDKGKHTDGKGERRREVPTPAQRRRHP